MSKPLNNIGHAGRPREFDAEKALDAAMRIFWKKGFEGTTLTDLTRAMEINRPSLYAAFGDKQQLFAKALERYSAANGPVSSMMDAINLPTARQVAEQILRLTVDGLTCPHHPRGCFMIQGALACGDAAEPARRELVSRRRKSEAVLRKRFARAVDEGDLPKGEEPAKLAKYINTITAGLAVQASGGATREEMLGVLATAMRAWPG